MPAISKMNKKELAQEIEELGGTANLDRRRLELQVQLISLREEQGIPNHTTCGLSTSILCNTKLKPSDSPTSQPFHREQRAAELVVPVS